MFVDVEALERGWGKFISLDKKNNLFLTVEFVVIETFQRLFLLKVGTIGKK